MNKDREKAKKYILYMVKTYKNYKDIRSNILSNLVNTEYGHTSNNYITEVWKELNKVYPS